MNEKVLAAATAAVALLISGSAPAQEEAEREASPLSSLIEESYALNELWDDGKAEVAAYDSTRIVYGEPREFTSRLITVSEPFNREYYVKADYPYGDKPLLPVLKQNYEATIPTDNYDYHFMTSVFAERENFHRTVKITVSSQEWCGITTKQFELWENPGRQIYSSYWDGEGTGERDIDAGPNTFFEEELFLVLRGLPFEEGLEASFDLYGNETTNKAPVPSATPSHLMVEEAAGEEKAWKVHVEVADGRDLEYVYDAEYPHVLRHFQHSDGRELDLNKVERQAYWNR